MGYDVILLHPPAFPDARERPRFYGPIAFTTAESTEQFATPPIGMLSIADYLDRHGYHVLVDNVAERVALAEDDAFSVRDHVKGLNARVCGIGLHWMIHAYGAMELARMCRELHPDSLIVMGGLTASIFHEEIVAEHGLVDAVIRGEAEEPFLRFMELLDAGHDLSRISTELPNITLRVNGRIIVGPESAPRESIDAYEFTRLDLLEPRALFTSRARQHWQLPVSRGCAYNCATCGGSSYSYRRYLGRARPAFRSPWRIAEDLSRLREHGVRVVFLFQDPRMGGRRYWEELIGVLKKEGGAMDHVTLELFAPADEEYVREVSRIGTSVSLTISPESGSEAVRRAHGRVYSNADLLRTVEHCRNHGVPLLVFFMLALGREDRVTIRDTWSLWERIMAASVGTHGGPTAAFGFGPMIILDPGSPAFDRPQKYGYRILRRTLKEHVQALSLPSWHQWFNYETVNLDRRSIVELILESLERAIALREKYGIYDRLTALRERLRVRISGIATREVDRIMLLDERTRASELAALHERLSRYEL